MMQDNESRLIKAAKRTIRAEVTLVIIIIVISSWSMYALYKFTTGSDSFFGLTFARPARQDRLSNGSSSSSETLANLVNPNRPVELPNKQSAGQLINYPQQDETRQKSQQLLQQLLAGQRELYANLGSFRAPVMNNPLDHIRRAPLVTNRLNEDGFRIIPGYHHLPVQQTQQSTETRLQQPGLEPNLVKLSNQDRLIAARELSRAIPTPTIDRQAPADAEADSDNHRADDDKEAAESSRESGGSVLDGSSGGDSSSSSSDTEGSHANSDEAPSEQDASTEGQEEAPQTTTTQPTSESNSESDSASSDESEPATRGDDDAPKETSQSIDDEVERMTQPSSGVVHQQERPFNYNKNTVQFDDSLSSGFGSPTASTKNEHSGDQVASFESPSRDSSSISNSPPDYDNETKDSDLQVDHNSLVVQSGSVNDTVAASPSRRRTSRRAKKVITNRIEEELADRANDTKANDANHVTDNFSNRASRQKRDSPKPWTKRIKAPYEFEDFLNKLDFDSLFGHSSVPQIVVRKPRNLDLNPAASGKSVAQEKAQSSNGTSADLDIRNQNIRRNGQDDGTSDEDIQFDNNVMKPPNLTQIYALANGSHPMPSYVTSNDSALQELLSKRQLLDALKYYQLPPPNQNDSSMDTKTAGSLYHVDHGLMLVPSADMRHSHKSKEASSSKKKKKQKEMKEKKKLTVAYKKGGHKKKKMKKEEKKFLKEKKFKAAKKGKKVSKGKGGAGGKKGKKLYKDKGFKKKGFKKVYHKEEWGNKKSYFDEFRDKDFKKKWKKFDDKYNYAQMKKFQAKDEKGAKKMKHHDESHKKYDKGKWKKEYKKKSKEHKEMSKKSKKKKKSGGSYD